MTEQVLSDQEVIQRLFNFGHFYSPEALEVDLIHETDLQSLSLNDEVVQAAVRSYQFWFLDDLTALTMRSVESGGLKRPAVADGDVGSNTRELLTSMRCGIPDYISPESAAQMRANWPQACRNEITTSYQMSLPGITPEKLAELWREADGHWENALELTMPFRPNSYPNTRIFAFMADLPSNVLADQYLAQNNCSARLQGRFDNRQWTDVLLVTTITHEHGHALGLGHLNNSNATMYPSITNASMGRHGKPSREDVAAAVGLGYRVRSSPPPPPPPPGGDVIRVDLRFKKADGSLVSWTPIGDSPPGNSTGGSYPTPSWVDAVRAAGVLYGHLTGNTLSPIGSLARAAWVLAGFGVGMLPSGVLDTKVEENENWEYQLAGWTGMLSVSSPNADMRTALNIDWRRLALYALRYLMEKSGA